MTRLKYLNKIPFLWDWFMQLHYQILHSQLYNMKNNKLLLTATAIACFAFVKYTGIVDNLGMNESDTKEHILKNIVGRQSEEPIEAEETFDSKDKAYEELKTFKIPYARLLPQIINGDKAAAAKEMCNYVKEYVNSQEFIDDYNNLREQTKPVSEPQQMDEATLKSLKAQLKEAEKSLAMMKGNKYIPASTLKQYEKSVADLKKQIPEKTDPTPNKTKWLKLYPENPANAVKKSLEEYLKIASSVNFKAETTGTGKRKKFVLAEYEAKSLKWKAIYRAGKDVNDVTVAFIKEWLKGDIISKELLPENISVKTETKPATKPKQTKTKN